MPEWVPLPVAAYLGIGLGAIVAWIGWHVGLALFVSVGVGAREAARTFVGIVASALRPSR